MPRRLALALLSVSSTATLVITSPVLASTETRERGAASLSAEGSLPYPSGQWSMFMNGPLRRGRTPIVGAQTSNLAWRISTQTNGGGTAIARDGTVYQGTDLGQLLAINPDGTKKWTVSDAYRVSSNPAILLDGRVAYVDEGGTLYVVNADGSPSWRFRTGTVTSGLDSSPAVGADGTVYTAVDQTVYAFHPDGSFRWVYNTGMDITGPVAVKPNGVVYVPAGHLLALNAIGGLLWDWTPPNLFVAGAPAIGPDGTIYVNSYSPTLYAVNPDGTTKWTYTAADCCGPDSPSSPVLGRDGTI